MAHAGIYARSRRENCRAPPTTPPPDGMKTYTSPPNNTSDPQFDHTQPPGWYHSSCTEREQRDCDKFYARWGRWPDQDFVRIRQPRPPVLRPEPERLFNPDLYEPDIDPKPCDRADYDSPHQLQKCFRSSVPPLKSSGLNACATGSQE